PDGSHLPGGDMKPLYVNYKGVAPEGDAVLERPEDVDTVFDGVRAEVADAGALLMMIGFVDDPDNGSLLQVGINGDKGLLTYDGEDQPDGLISYAGKDIGGAVYYSFQGTKAEFPASAEVPFDVMKRAVKEFLETGGALPTVVEWRPDVD
ncbi:MAG TPA: Imm1 family immunity protein, partial [Actinopolymorphaceae bacterium]